MWLWPTACQVDHWKNGGHKKACKAIAVYTLNQLLLSLDVPSLASLGPRGIVDTRKLIELLWRFRSEPMCLKNYFVFTLRLAQYELELKSKTGMEWLAQALMRSMRELSLSRLAKEGWVELCLCCISTLSPLGYQRVVLQYLIENEEPLKAAASTDLDERALLVMWLDTLVHVLKTEDEANRDEAMVDKAMVVAQMLVDFTSRPGRKASGQLSNANVRSTHPS